MTQPLPTTIDVAHILSLSWTTTTTIHPTTTIAYNLALGAPGTALQHVYEAHPSFQPLPTYATTFAIAAMSLVHQSMPTFLPAFQAHNHIHASHWLVLHRPYPLTGTLTHQARVVAVSPVRNGISLTVHITSATPTNTLITTQQWTSIVLHVPTDKLIPATSPSVPSPLPTTTAPPPHPPTLTRTHKTTPEQSALYRAASGDLNPLHIDPATARRAGFPAPLMTGTCTIGVGVRIVVGEFGEMGQLREVRCRLRRPVYAGEEVRVEMWVVEEGLEGRGRGLVVWRMVVGEGEGMKVVVDGAACLFGREREGEGEGEGAKL